MLARIAHAALSMPGRWKDQLYCHRLRDLAEIDASATLTPSAKIFNARKAVEVRIGAGTLFCGEILTFAFGGRVRIGDWCYVGPGSRIWSMEFIEIGNRVMISHGVQIFDSDTHSLSAKDRADRFHELRTKNIHLERENALHKPVSIADDVWIGCNASIMKGVRIGRGSIIGTCAVVTHDVGEYEVVAGNPARKVGESRA